MSEAFSCLVWNVRGLNDRARRTVVRSLVAAHRPSFVCLQETKISDRVADFAIEILGTTFQYDFVPSVGASGGILLAWSSPAWEVSNVWKGHFSLSVQLTRPGSADFTWWLTTVYGPQPDIDKAQFLDELREFRAVAGGPWLLCGDFNMIYRAQDKNNDRLDRRCMRRFRRFLSELLLEEIEI